MEEIILKDYGSNPGCSKTPGCIGASRAKTEERGVYRKMFSDEVCSTTQQTPPCEGGCEFFNSLLKKKGPGGTTQGLINL